MPPNILLVRFSAIGDILLMTPLLRAPRLARGLGQRAERHPVAARVLKLTLAQVALMRGDDRTLALRENVVLQPHVASATHPTRKAMGQLVIVNLAAHFAGKPLVTPI